MAHDFPKYCLVIGKIACFLCSKPLFAQLNDSKIIDRLCSQYPNVVVVLLPAAVYQAVMPIYVIIYLDSYFNLLQCQCL